MKKSARITLTVVATVGLASCSRRHPDPCIATSFNQQACQEAIDNRGYHYQGSWYPMTYSYPYPYYYDSYQTHVARGGKVRSEPMTSYSSTYRGSKYSSGSTTGGSSGVTRGGFGSSGSGSSGG